MKQNTLEHMDTHPHAVQVVLHSFYVDDGLTGANSIEEAVQLRKELTGFIRTRRVRAS